MIIFKDTNMDVVDRFDEELEFIEYDFGLIDEDILNNDFVKTMTFTKMDVCLELISKKIEHLGLYDCFIIDMDYLSDFRELTTLEITNMSLNGTDILDMKNLKFLNVNYSEILNLSIIKNLNSLEKISLVGATGDFEQLIEFNSLKVIIVDSKTYEDNKHIFIKLVERGIKIMNYVGV